MWPERESQRWEPIMRGLQHRVSPGGEIYVHQSHALEFLERCKQASIGLLGFDALLITDGETQPLLDGIVVISYPGRSVEDWSAFVERSNGTCRWEASELQRKFADRAAELHFAFVIQFPLEA